MSRPRGTLELRAEGGAPLGDAEAASGSRWTGTPAFVVRTSSTSAAHGGRRARTATYRGRLVRHRRRARRARGDPRRLARGAPPRPRTERDARGLARSRRSRRRRSRRAPTCSRRSARATGPIRSCSAPRSTVRRTEATPPAPRAPTRRSAPRAARRSSAARWRARRRGVLRDLRRARGAQRPGLGQRAEREPARSSDLRSRRGRAGRRARRARRARARSSPTPGAYCRRPAARGATRFRWDRAFAAPRSTPPPRRSASGT